jgi:hypothetical protein
MRLIWATSGRRASWAGEPLRFPAGREKIDFGAQNYLLIVETHRNINPLSAILDAGPQRNFVRRTGNWQRNSVGDLAMSKSIIYPFDN